MRYFSLFIMVISTIIMYADIPAGYYDKAVGKKDAELKTAMHEIIESHTRIEYGSKGTWEVFRTSDVRADGSIWDMYSAVVRYFPESGSHPDMHIEHSVPKSWWGEESTFIYDASFDLHHLVPSDASANMSKSNRILGVVDESIDKPTLDNGVSKSGKARIGDVVHSVFEPHDDYKGDFARMYMYVVTCYQDYTWQSNGVNMFNTEAYPTLNEYARELLMDWHRLDPVSVKEINRNEAVYNAQDNRNPFIDFPLLAEYLWGDSVGCAFVMQTIETPYLVTPSHGEKIDMGTIMTGSSVEYNLYIEAKNLTEGITFAWKQRAGVELSATSMTVEQAEAGADVTLRYNNKDLVGVLRDTLVVSGGGLLKDVELPVVLYGTSSFIPLTPTDVTSTGATLQWVAMPGAHAYRVALYEGAAEATDLFISAYVEGSSYNKAIALYNGTKHAINIADYALGIQRNGEGDFVNYWQLPDDVLQAGDTYIIVSSSCDEGSALRQYADAFIPSLETSPLNFNGNDAIALYHNRILSDVVGRVGSVENWGKDITLYRSPATLGPTTEYNELQWQQAPKDDFAQLRTHTMQGVTDTPTLVVQRELNDTHLDVDELKPSTIYTYRVTAIMQGGEQEAIYGCAFTTDALAVPADMSVGEVGYNTIECSWSEVPVATAYEVNCTMLQGTESITISEGFDAVSTNGKPLPEGWSGNASGNYTSDASSGHSAPSVALKNSGEYIETPEYDAPVTVLSFMYRFASAATGSSLLVEYKKDGSWLALQTIDYVNTTKQTLDYHFEASDNVRAFRFTYSKSKGNMAIDDVVVTYGALEEVTVVEAMSVSEPCAMLQYLRGGRTYNIRVRSALGDCRSVWSEPVTVTALPYPTSVSMSDKNDIRYTVSGHTIAFYDLPIGSKVFLYDLRGELCYQGVVDNSVFFTNVKNSGVYIAKIVNDLRFSYLKVAVSCNE